MCYPLLNTFFLEAFNYIQQKKNIKNMSKISDSRKTTVPFMCDLESDVPLMEMQSYDPDSFDMEIERAYAGKFKQQRQKIQMITKEFENQRSVLDQKVEYIDTLEKKVVQLSEISIFKKKYQDLYRDYKILENDHHRCKIELENTRSDLTQALQDKMFATKEMRTFFKDSSYKFNEQISELRQLIEQKQKLIESAQQKSSQQAKILTDQIRDQEARFSRQQQDWFKTRESLEDEIAQLNKSLAQKDTKIKELEIEIFGNKSKIESLSYELEDKDNAMVSMNEEYKQLYQKMKFHIRALKKQIFDKQEEIICNKENISKLNEQSKRSDRKIFDLSEQIKLQTKNFEDTTGRAQFEWEEDKRRFIEINSEYKATIEELVKAKSHLTQENDRLVSMLRQKDTMQKLRNQIKRSEFSQIDRVERIVRKI